MYSTQSLAAQALAMFEQRPPGGIRTLSITSYELSPAHNPQRQLFETEDVKKWKLTEFMDGLNDRYGEFSIMPASMANTDNYVADKIPFGSTRYFEYKHSR